MISHVTHNTQSQNQLVGRRLLYDRRLTIPRTVEDRMKGRSGLRVKLRINYHPKASQAEHYFVNQSNWWELPWHSLKVLYSLHLFFSDYSGAGIKYYRISNNNFNFSLSLSFNKNLRLGHLSLNFLLKTY